MIPHILFLTVRMQPGFGVAVVIEEISRRLIARGISVSVGCQEMSGDFGTLPVRRVAADSARLSALVEELGATHVIAHASPYFEALPTLRDVSTWAWEHGDPDPDFFSRSRSERQAQIQRKKTAVYPNLDGVIAISDFIREQIGWPAAQVIRNGWEHVLKRTTDAAQDVPLSAQAGQLKVGCLMRLGRGEERYKGGELYRALASTCPQAHFSLMGRGEAEDETRYAQAGIQVFRNASDAAREAYLRQIDVFVSPSLWEGCNLPLLEAQAQGTASLAFDTGAHPEFGALVCGSVDEMSRLIQRWQNQRDALETESRRIQQWVRSTLSWDDAVDALLHTLLSS